MQRQSGSYIEATWHKDALVKREKLISYSVEENAFDSNITIFKKICKRIKHVPFILLS